MRKNSINHLLILLVFLTSFFSNAQVGISTDGSNPDASAMLDVKSTEKGILIPRMTYSEIADIENPVFGLMVFNTDDGRFYFYDDGTSNWKELAIGTNVVTPFVCGNTFVDTRDGTTYTTVPIGSQCWMAENLNIGAEIHAGTNQSDNSTIEKFCYQNNSSYCDTYGGLYQWDEMMQYATTEGVQGICPAGWHLPTDEEWKTMEIQLGMDSGNADAIYWRNSGNVGQKLKEAGTAHWVSSSGSNSSGFTAFGSGYRSGGNNFNNLRYEARFWTSSEYNLSNAWFRFLSYSQSGVYREVDSKTNKGYCVRCVKD